MGLLRFVLEELRGIARTFGLTLYYVFRGRWRWAPVLEQMFQVGNRSVFFILVTMGFLGAILNFQTGFQAMRLSATRRCSARRRCRCSSASSGRRSAG
jgi:ABC-type transporter Mla maintaining outer membrane lipid asymmetry permease subunit MlaE